MIDFAPLTFRVEPMRPEDIDRVMQIERVVFSAPWSARAYDYELHYNDMARYFVARPQNGSVGDSENANTVKETREREDAQKQRSLWRRFLGLEKLDPAPPPPEGPPVVGYGGFWLMVDEAHISTIASHPQWRGRGIGELLLVTMIDAAIEMGANAVTLEVRVSNSVAQDLYRKYGFERVGTRKGYYSDNGEDALIMTTPRVTSAQFNRRFQELRKALSERLAH